LWIRLWSDPNFYYVNITKVFFFLKVGNFMNPDPGQKKITRLI